MEAAQHSDPLRRREDDLRREQVRLENSSERLVTAYQEELLTLAQLRQRMPSSRKQQQAVESELHSLEMAAADQSQYLRLTETLGEFRVKLQARADTLDVAERQKILRLLVKEVLVDSDTITIRHSIPIPQSGPHSGGSPSSNSEPGGSIVPSYLLRSGSQQPSAGQSVHEPFSEVLAAKGKGTEFRAIIVNYADDFVILSRGCAAEALEWTDRTMARIGLTLNREKTKLVKGKQQRFDFLGYTFGPHRFKKDGHWYLEASPSTKSVARLRRKVHEVLRPSEVGRWEEVRGRLNRVLVGWSNYFSYGTRLMAYRAVDNHVCERVRGFLRRRKKVSSARHPAVQRPGGVWQVRCGTPAPEAPGSAACDSLRDEAGRRAGCGKSARPVR